LKEKEMFYLLGSLVILSVIDAGITYYMVGLGLVKETNSFLAPMVGEPAFFAVKFFGMLLAAFLLWDITRRHPKLGLAATACSVAVYALIVMWNLSVLVRLRPFFTV
jgi:hypothetical protein